MDEKDWAAERDAAYERSRGLGLLIGAVVVAAAAGLLVAGVVGLVSLVLESAP